MADNVAPYGLKALVTGRASGPEQDDPWSKFRVQGSAPAQSLQDDPWAKFRIKSAEPPQVDKSWSDTAIDAAKSYGSGLVEGVTSLTALPGTMVDAGWRVARDAAVKGREMVGLPFTPEQIATMDANIAAMQGVRSQVMPNADERKASLEGYVGELHKPETTIGKYAHTLGEFTPNVASPGSIPQRVIGQTILPALASEAAGQMTKGTALEGPARIIAPLAVGGLSSLAGRAPYAERLAGRAAENISSEQFDAADELIRQARARGIQLTPAEAIQQVTGGQGSGLGRVQRLSESLDGSGRIADVMAMRPSQAQQAANAAFDQVAPRSATPSFQASQAQEVAQGAIDHTRQSINRLAQPYYDQLPSQMLDPRDAEALTRSPSYATALQEIRGNPELNARIAELPDDSAAVVNAVVQRLDRNVAASRQTALNPQGDNNLAAVRQGARSEADMAAAAASPEYRTARDIVSQGRERVLDPLQAGPVGRMAATNDVVEQGKALMGDAPSPQEVTRATSVLMGRDPAITRGVVREQLGRLADKTVGGLDSSGRPDQFAGAKLAREMRAGRKGQNIDAAIEAASGAPVKEEINRVVDALQATGWRQRPGSMTAFNAEDIAAMKSSPFTKLTTPMKQVADALTSVRLKGQSNRLADLMLDPNGVRRIQELAAAGDDRAVMVVRALMAQRAGSSSDPVPATR